MLTGSCMLDLGDPAAASGKFADADAAFGPEYVRTHVLYPSRIATAQLQQREIDTACATAHQALDLAADLQSGRSSDHLHDLAGHLARHRRNRDAVEVLDRIASLA
ncbi:MULTISPECIES: hypothetical protein [unclassified Streptomyces]|uniref:hypothetical protein n=1 Tax=unclassified Streptomyces TaxID=2593676 RepID=UPI001944116F|nr:MULTISPECIES: hypothetical protein [unclassified Streptomyces]